MRFNDNARLDTGQVEDRRGSGGGGLGGLGRGGTLAAGGGGLGLIAVVVVVLINVFSGSGSSAGGNALGNALGQVAGGGNPQVQVDTNTLAGECRTGADANAGKDDCIVVAVVNSVQDYWSQQLARSGTRYTDAKTVFYSGSTPTGCGTGSTGMGPFYCPADQQVYIDLTFWNELKTTFGANDAPFTQAYVIAHEYGHHVQNLLGTNNRVGTATGATSGSVRLELQADCYAGVWAKHASTTDTGSGSAPVITDITSADLANAVDTAGKIGDDYIQSTLGGGGPDPSSYTHGTSAQRKKWLQLGFSSGNPASCNTFDTQNLG
jgi:uncharacterized protein